MIHKNFATVFTVSFSWRGDSSFWGVAIRRQAFIALDGWGVPFVTTSVHRPVKIITHWSSAIGSGNDSLCWSTLWSIENVVITNRSGMLAHSRDVLGISQIHAHLTGTAFDYAV